MFRLNCNFLIVKIQYIRFGIRNRASLTAFKLLSDVKQCRTNGHHFYYIIALRLINRENIHTKRNFIEPIYKLGSSLSTFHGRHIELTCTLFSGRFDFSHNSYAPSNRYKDVWYNYAVFDEHTRRRTLSLVFEKLHYYKTVSLAGLKFP